ncbi:MAG: preprotein translocase subunit SecA [Candidatus Doudnabacteria bacterium]|nr:preprotein translocase subunit SecA [Candidatus Doudnabacteria bacterium]
MPALEELRQKVDDYIDHRALADLVYRVRLVLKEREELKNWSDKDLRLAGTAFKQDLVKGKSLDSIVVSAFAVVNEAARRVTKKLAFPVQILAGLVINNGVVAEMKAGEGKTLTETMPVYTNALLGHGVHLVTTNDYLAERDAKAMGEVFNFLGLSVGYISTDMKGEQRRKSYGSDITYVTNQEVGFDYLRDNLVFSRSERVLRPEHPLFFGIVDEIDSILIDESRTPLIIAQPVKEERNYYDLFTKIAAKLEEDKDYTVDYQKKLVSMTDEGLDNVEQMLASPVFSKDNPMYVFYLDVCLKAKVIFEKDRDYIVTPEGVEIVDEFTGRVMPGRRFTDGVHQAIEAKEKVKIKGSDKTAANITFQNFFPMYEKLSGMSGTVMRARDEFKRVYKLEVTQIPTNRPLIRVDHNDLFFKTEKGKFLGLVKKVREIHGKGQPLLIGARNVETAHIVSGILEQSGHPYQLLTAKDHRSEADKISKAGQEGMITVATNMAGRGTDILLGDGVENLGGLFVLGTERHESRRIDDQLVGRSGRQGEPGESQFLISMEDEIMSLFGSETIIDAMEDYDIPEDEYISGQGLNAAFKKAQDFVESKNLDSRLYLYKYDSITSYQRKSVYHLRDSLLENEENFLRFLRDSVQETLNEILALGSPALIVRDMLSVFRIQAQPDEVSQALGLADNATENKDRFFNEWFNPFYQVPEERPKSSSVADKLNDYLQALALKIKNEPEVYIAARSLILQIIDNQWSQQLEAMDVLKQESSLFSYASEDPLVDFISDGQILFKHMMDNINRQFLSALFTRLEQEGLLE